MPSNIDYDPFLLNEAVKLGGFRYKKEAVNAALKEFVQHHKQLKLIELFGTIEYNENYNYKKERKRESFKK